MSLESCYEQFGGDLEGVRGRLLTDDRIKKFMGIFIQDTSFQLLIDSWESKDNAEAFRAAHTLKGIGRDLGFTPLCEASSALADALRPDENGNPANLEAAPALLDQTKDAYELIIGVISAELS
ncbi:Hpt domain-containing protein [Eggerthellaceae bacterium 3-80]|nr:Hpt domain-containing protein [bacterium D16-34]